MAVENGVKTKQTLGFNGRIWYIKPSIDLHVVVISWTAGPLGQWQHNPTVCDIALVYGSASVS